MTPGEIWIARFPFAGTTGSKVRPVLLLSGPLSTIPEFITAYITKAIPSPLLPSDIVIDPKFPEHDRTGISSTSVIRLHKISTVHRRDLIRSLGTLPASLAPTISAALRTALAF